MGDSSLISSLHLGVEDASWERSLSEKMTPQALGKLRREKGTGVVGTQRTKIVTLDG